MDFHFNRNATSTVRRIWDACINLLTSSQCGLFSLDRLQTIRMRSQFNIDWTHTTAIILTLLKLSTVRPMNTEVQEMKLHSSGDLLKRYFFFCKATHSFSLRPNAIFISWFCLFSPVVYHKHWSLLYQFGSGVTHSCCDLRGLTFLSLLPAFDGREARWAVTQATGLVTENMFHL